MSAALFRMSARVPMRRLALVVLGATAAATWSGSTVGAQQAPLATRGTVWATSRGPDTVAAFDGKTGRVLSTIRVGRAPMGTVVPVRSNKLYVGNEGSNSVSVISIPRRSVIATIPVGARPHHMTQSPDGSRVYVAEFGTNKIGVVEVMTDSLVAEWETGPPSERTHSPAPSRDGKTLYAINSRANRIVALDARTGAIQWSMAAGVNPSELLVAPGNRTGYLSVRDEDQIEVVDLVARRVVREVAVGDQPDTLQMTPDGRFLVVALRSDPGPAEVDVVDLKRNFAVTRIRLNARLAGHNWLSANGRYTFVSAEDPPSVHVIDHRTHSVVATWPYPGGGSVHGMFYDDPRGTEGPDMSVARRVVVRGRRARVRVTCAEESVLRCRGRLVLRDRRSTLGKARFALAAGGSAVVPVELNPHAAAALLQRRSLRTNAMVVATDALKHERTISRTVLLIRAGRK